MSQSVLVRAIMYALAESQALLPGVIERLQAEQSEELRDAHSTLCDVVETLKVVQPLVDCEDFDYAKLTLHQQRMLRTAHQRYVAYCMNELHLLGVVMLVPVQAPTSSTEPSKPAPPSN